MVRSVDQTTTIVINTLSKRIGPKELQQVLRIVGFFEYANALRLLDSFASNLTKEEYQQVEDYLKQKKEFAVYTHLSRFVRHPRHRLDERPVSSDDRFERRGLSYLTALARTELASMLAVHTFVERPYAVVGYSRHDRQAYNELLLDGVRTHYWGLKTDRNFLPTIKDYAITDNLLSYGRRLLLARKMARAIEPARSRTLGLDENGSKELARWVLELDGHQQQVNKVIRRFFRSSGVSSERHERAYACRSLLDFEKRDRRAGKAKVRRISGSSRTSQGFFFGGR